MQASFKGTRISLLVDEVFKERKILNDQARLENVLVDLLQNALKFCERGEITIQANCTPVGDNYIAQISVHNTSSGRDGTKDTSSFRNIMRISFSGEGTILKKRDNIGMTLQVCELIVNQIGPKQQL